MTWSDPLPAGPPLGPPPVETHLDEGVAVAGVVGRRWWLAVLLGLVTVGLGVWLLANLVESVLVLALIIGVSLITGGLVDALVLDRGGARWASWLEGLLLVLAGIVVLAWPDITLWVLTVTAGLTLLLGGIAQVLIAIAHHRRPGWSVHLGLGGFGIAVGAVVLAWPEATLVVIAVLFGIRAVVVGLVAIGAGWQMRRQTAELAAVG